MSAVQWPREPLQDARWHSDMCRHRHRSRDAAVQCEDREWRQRQRAISVAPQHKVTIRRVYEVTCETCGDAVIDAPPSRAVAEQAKRDHIAAQQQGERR